MELLLRRIQRDRKGNEEAFEDTLSNPLITVGHLNDQVIQLLDPAVSPRHLVLTARSNGRFGFKTIGAATVGLDGKECKRGTLKPGDSIDIGAQQIRVAEPVPGFDGTLELISIEQDEAFGPATHFRTELAQTGLGARGWAWLLFALVGVLFFAVPLGGYFYPDVEQKLQEVPLIPTDISWDTGPLANVHHLPEIGKDCNTCHLKLFERVPDRACLDCHAEVTAHVDRERVAVSELAETRCATCHEEHNEPTMLVRSDAGLCLDCHRLPGESATVLTEGELPAPVSGFTSEAHPEFRLSLLQQTGLGGGWDTQRMVWSLDDLKEQSHLKFPHNIHLNGEKVQSLQTGQPLMCADCHELSGDGEHFVPITMERHCRDCHGLSFDDDFPQKQLPHGNVRAAVVALQEHFIRKFADPQLRDMGDRFRRRRPGMGGSSEECQGTALECGRKLALREATSQFTRSGCVTCHEVAVNPEAPVLERWHVQPVRLATDWYPFSDFDHVAHLTQSVSRGSGEAPCSACHQARASEVASDILIPGRDNCVACHSEGEGPTFVALSCRGCHGFHLPGRGIMRARTEPDASQGVAKAAID